MTVGKLIEVLKQCPEDSIIKVNTPLERKIVNGEVFVNDHVFRVHDASIGINKVILYCEKY